MRGTLGNVADPGFTQRSGGQLEPRKLLKTLQKVHAILWVLILTPDCKEYV